MLLKLKIRGQFFNFYWTLFWFTNPLFSDKITTPFELEQAYQYIFAFLQFILFFFEKESFTGKYRHLCFLVLCVMYDFLFRWIKAIKRRYPTKRIKLKWSWISSQRKQIFKVKCSSKANSISDSSRSNIWNILIN